MRNFSESMQTSPIVTGALAEELAETLQRVRLIAKKEKKKTGFCIGNTKKKVSRDYFFTPIRNTTFCVAGSIIIDKIEIAEFLFQVLDGKVDYLFVDTEKKISPQLYSLHDAGNVERTARKMVRESILFTYKGNDLTVDALDSFLAQKVCWDEKGLGGKKIAVIGAGNIGFKISLKLLERGAHPWICRRSTNKLRVMIDALNIVKPESTIAVARGSTKISECIEKADVVIGLTPGASVITPELLHLINNPAVLIDAGKGSFARQSIVEASERGMPVYRSNIVGSFEAQVGLLLKTWQFINSHAGRGVIDGVPVVAGGLVGFRGELVVNDINFPSEIYGVADGSGDFIQDLDEQQAENIEILRRWISSNSLERFE